MDNIYSCTLPKTALQYAAENLNEIEEERDGNIYKIQTWLQTQPHLNARTDAPFVLRFLRSCKFDLGKVQHKMKNYFEMRTKVPEWFCQRDPRLPQLQELINIGVFLPLRQPDSEGRLVVLIRGASHDPYRHLQSDVFKVSMMILDLVMEQEEMISVFGVVALIDLGGVTLGHALQLTPSVIKKAVHSWQDCYPLQPKRLDFVNAPSYVNMILNIFKKFMREKLRKRVSVHSGGPRALHKIVPTEILPHEYGGTSGTLSELIEYWKQQLIDNRDWLLENEKYKAELK